MDYEKQLNEIIGREGKEFEIKYSPLEDDSYPVYGNIEIGNMPGLIGYLIALRGDNLFINDLMTISTVEKKNLEVVLNINESLAKEFNCSSITVEGGEEEIKSFYETQGYQFGEGKYVGGKNIK